MFELFLFCTVLIGMLGAMYYIMEHCFIGLDN